MDCEAVHCRRISRAGCFRLRSLSFGGQVDACAPRPWWDLRLLHFAAMCLPRSVADFGTIITEKARWHCLAAPSRASP